MKAEFVSRAKLSEQAERYDDMAEYMRKVTESGLGNFLLLLGSRRWNWKFLDFLKIRIPNFCYIQVIVFDLSYLPVAGSATGSGWDLASTLPWKNVKNI